MITFTRTAAALAFAAFLAPGVSVAATDCSAAATHQAFSACVDALTKVSDAQAVAINKFGATVLTKVRSHQQDLFVYRLYSKNDMTGRRDTGFWTNRYAADVIPEASLSTIDAPPYVRAQMKACLHAGWSLAYFAYSQGCLDTLDADRDRLTTAGALLYAAEQLETESPDIAAALRKDFRALVHMLAELNAGMSLLVPAVDRALYSKSSKALFDFAGSGLADLAGYVANLRRELAGLPLDDWRTAAPGVR